MTATFVDATNDPTSADEFASTKTTQKPAGAQLAVVWISMWTGAGGGTITPSGGSGSWVQRGDVTNGNNRTVVFLKYVDSDATSTTYTFTFAGGSTWAALKAHYVADVDAGLTLSSVPFDLVAGSSGNYASASVTADSGAFLSWNGYADYSGTPTHTPPTDFTETGDTYASVAAYRIAPSDGTQTASGGSVSESVTTQAGLLAIAPAAAGGAVVQMPRAVIVAG